MTLKLRCWPDSYIDIVADMPMKEAMEYFWQIGCVYPYDEESFYIDSNIQNPTIYCECNDGGFFGVYDGDISELPRIPD